MAALIAAAIATSQNGSFHLVTADYRNGNDISKWHRNTTLQYFPESSHRRTRSRRAVQHRERSLLIILPTYTNASVQYDYDDVYKTMWVDSAEAVFEASSYGRLTYPSELGAIVSVNVSRGLGPYCSYWEDTEHILDNWTAQENWQDFDSILTFLPTESGCTWSGLAIVNGCTGSNNDYCKAWIITNDASTIAHELGHTIHFGHASSNPEDDGTNSVEYGDPTDVMGSALLPVMFNFVHATEQNFTRWEWSDATDCTVKHIAALHIQPQQNIVHGILTERLPSLSEVAEREAHCTAYPCIDDRTTFSKFVIFDRVIIARTVYYVSYRSSGGIDANLGKEYKNKVYVHSYANNTNKDSIQQIDNARLVATIDKGETWHGTSLSVSVISMSQTEASISFCSHHHHHNDTLILGIVAATGAALLLVLCLALNCRQKSRLKGVYNTLPTLDS